MVHSSEGSKLTAPLHLWEGLGVGIFLFLILFFSSCQESLEERAVRQAKEYTERYCPTPEINYSRTDSIVFDQNRHVYIYYLSFCGMLDDQKVVDENRNRITDMLTQSVRESTGLRNFIEAGFKFEYVCHSEKEPRKVLFRIII
jgi:hypothetical protein